jgi:hypothetical protein
MSAMMVCASAIRPPPPSPCSARARTSQVMLCAMAQAMDPTMKMTIAVSMMTRRPYMSDNLP